MMTFSRPVLALLLLLLLLAAAACAAELDLNLDLNLHNSNTTELFHRFLARFRRSYAAGSAEYRSRLEHFKNNVARAVAMNAASRGRPGHTAVFGVTQFSDWSPEELARLRGAKPANAANGLAVAAPMCNTPVTCNMAHNVTVPAAFDWRNDSRRVITSVLDQGQCGSCWAFGSVATAESAWAIAGNPPVQADGHASVQQLMSCDTVGQHGCLGGVISNAMSYLVQTSQEGRGLEADKLMPYACGKGCANLPACPANTTGPVVKLNSTCSCSPWNEVSMKVYIAKHGPATIMVDADPWTSYISGIMRYHCSSLMSSGDHAVQLVGYGEEVVYGQTIPYWIVRNSWGISFGEQGYIRLYRGANVCGVVNSVNLGFAIKEE